MEKVLITILDGISETSMPYNEFVLWRSNHYDDEKQILVILGEKLKEPVVNKSARLEIVQIGRNPFKIRKGLSDILDKLNSSNSKYSIHLHQLKSASLAQLSMLGTGFRRKTVFTIHSTFTGYALHNKIQSYFNGLMARYVTCVSEASYAKYPKSLKRMKGSRVLPVRNGVDCDRIDMVLKGVIPHKEDGKVKFIYVARLIPLKNHAFLMNIIKKVAPEAQFFFVGRDGDSGIMDMIKKERMDDRIVLTGQVPREKVFDLLNSSDIYISTSTLEGMPISVLEAMYCKLPAILSDIPQHREIGGEDSFVSYLPFDEDKWIEKINAIVKMQNDERRSYGLNSRNYVKKHFSLNSMHKKYDEIYEKLRD